MKILQNSTHVLTFNEFVNERLFGSGVRRAQKNEVRQDEKCTLPWGETIKVNNNRYDFEKLVKSFFDSSPHSGARLTILPVKNTGYPERLLKYGYYAHTFLLTDECCVKFPSYKLDMCELNKDLIEGCDWDDYQTICEAVAERLKKMNLIWFKEHESYGLLLVHEDADKKIGRKGGYYMNLFVDAFKKKFGDKDFYWYANTETELELRKFSGTVVANDGFTIALRINYKVFLEFEDYQLYSNEFLKVVKLEEES